jgi:hypothetical protein
MTLESYRQFHRRELLAGIRWAHYQATGHIIAEDEVRELDPKRKFPAILALEMNCIKCRIDPLYTQLIFLRLQTVAQEAYEKMRDEMIDELDRGYNFQFRTQKRYII